MGLPPGTTTTSSGWMATPWVRLTRTAMASRSSGRPGRGNVVRPSAAQRVHGRFHNVLRGVEVGLANLQMHDVSALALERLRFAEDFKGCLRTQALHAARQNQLVSDHLHCHCECSNPLPGRGATGSVSELPAPQPDGIILPGKPAKCDGRRPPAESAKAACAHAQPCRFVSRMFCKRITSPRE